MALNASDWLEIDPRRDPAMRELIKERTGSIDKLADTLNGDELMALLVKVDMFLELHLSNRNLASTADNLRDARLRKAPEPAGIDWACESPGRAADVVEACRLIVKKTTGLHGRNWPGRVADFMPEGRHVYISPRLWNRWRRGAELVDRDVVVAALKVARVEDARELRT